MFRSDADEDQSQRSRQFHVDGSIDMSQEKWAVKGSDSVAAIGQSALFRFFFSSFWLVIRFPAALLAHRFTGQVDTVSIVNQPIHDAVGKARVTDLLVPVRNR